MNNNNSNLLINILSSLNCSNNTIYLVKPAEECIDKDMKLTDTNVITIIVYSVIFFFSAILNIWMLIIMYRNKKNDYTRVQRFMLHLNIADLIVTFITIPLEIGWKWSVMWLAGDIGCRFFQFLRPLGIYLTSFILISMSIDRYAYIEIKKILLFFFFLSYLAIINPLSIKNSNVRTNILIYSPWVISIICSIPQVN